VRKRHNPPLAADAVAKAAFVPPLPTVKPVTNWAKLGQLPRWMKLGGATGKRFIVLPPEFDFDRGHSVWTLRVADTLHVA